MGFRRSRSPWPVALLVLVLLAALAGSALLLTQPVWRGWLYGVTGEESLPGQVRGGLEWLGNLTRPQPDTADLVPVAHAGVNPFGVNVFLEQEVEPEKRERAAQMIAEAGFHWLRQEFPWEDIEIHGKGDFTDRRHEPARSAWEKYDHIVDLAEEYGLELMVRLSNPPPWSRAAGDDAGSFGPPDNLEDYGDFCEAVARRYRGRVSTYQIWNEPNIYPEWGEAAVSPEEYTALLKVGYTRIKLACPECIVLSGALAQTIPLGPRDLNDFLFLQRMYEAGAAGYFDVLAMQGYGLWSGPTDRRMRARVLNFSRPLYLREIMVANGDAHKPIWITELNWNAPPDDLPDKPFGAVTPQQQARYAVEGFRRAQQEWPWVGVTTAWFFKRATDTEAGQAMYYFRLVEPDFTPSPVYDALAAYMTGDEARVLYPGVHQEDHWALDYGGTWQTQADPSAELGGYRYAVDERSSLSFAFSGTHLSLLPGPGVGPEEGWTLSIDGGLEEAVQMEPGQPAITLAQGLAPGRHTAVLRPLPGARPALDSLTVQERQPVLPWIAAGAAALALILAGALLVRGLRRRRPWYVRGKGWR